MRTYHKVDLEIYGLAMETTFEGHIDDCFLEILEDYFRTPIAPPAEADFLRNYWMLELQISNSFDSF